MTYATLKADIATWARRGDLTAAIPSFVLLAESEIYKTHAQPLRVREMETEATIVSTDLRAPLPDDFLSARYLKLSNAAETRLQYEAPEAWNESHSGYFTTVGSEVRLPTCAAGNALLVYLAKPAALSNDTDTNAILDAYYGIYLSASMKYASAYVKDVASVQLYQSQLDAYLDGAARHNKPITVGSLVVRSA